MLRSKSPQSGWARMKLSVGGMLPPVAVMLASSWIPHAAGGSWTAATNCGRRHVHFSHYTSNYINYARYTTRYRVIVLEAQIFRLSSSVPPKLSSTRGKHTSKQTIKNKYSKKLLRIIFPYEVILSECFTSDKYDMHSMSFWRSYKTVTKMFVFII